MLVTPPSSTTIAILTPSGRGAVAVVSIRGANAAALVSMFFVPRSAGRWKHAAVGEMLYGRWTSDAAAADAPAEDVIVSRVANDTIEVHCHGGIASKRIAEDLLNAGAQLCDWKALASQDKETLIRAAARVALSDTVTERTAGVLLDQYNGALETAIKRIAEKLETDASTALSGLQQLVDRASIGLHLANPWRVVIAGAPNVGKSSLINAIVGYDRALVFDQPGTTRDAVEATTSLDGWPVTFIDTAGLRTTADAIEIAGIERARDAAKTADCVLLVFDASEPWTDECDDIAREWPNAIVVHNKSDLQVDHEPKRLAGIMTSALLRHGIDWLTVAIIGRLVSAEIRPGDAVPFCKTHVEQLEIAKHLIERNDLAGAKSALLALIEPR
jgi:tRNA modification GTPase